VTSWINVADHSWVEKGQPSDSASHQPVDNCIISLYIF